MKPNEAIQKRREELGLREDQIAASAQLGIYAYGDIEFYEDEAYQVADLGSLRAICDVLGLDLLSLFDIPYPLCSDEGLVRDLYEVPRSQLISRKRMSLGLTREQLGDLIGFETVAIEQMEQDPGFLESWSVELIQDLATHLQLPVTALLRVGCRK